MPDTQIDENFSFCHLTDIIRKFILAFAVYFYYEFKDFLFSMFLYFELVTFLV